MLKNIKIYALFLITIGFIACSEDNEIEPLFDQDGSTRTTELLASYKKTLTDAEFGWKLVYQPKNSVGFYNIFLDFNEDNTVEIVSDYAQGTQDLETTYRVGKSQFPELVFENYSTFHNLFEVSNFTLQAEFEFIFENVTADKVEFRSKTDNEDDVTKIVFEKATAGEKERVINTRTSYDEIAIGNGTVSFLRNIVVTDPTAGAMDPPLFQGTFSFSEFERVGIITTLDQSTGNTTSISYPIVANENGFAFANPFQVNGVDITNFTFDEVNNTYVSEDGGVNSIIGYDLIAPAVPVALIPSLFSTDVDTFETNFTRYLYFDDSSQFYLQQTSPDFLNLVKSIGASGLTIDMNAFGPGVHGVTFRGISDAGGPLTAAFSFTVIPGERVTLSYLGATGAIDDIISVLLLLIDGEGWYINETGESTFQGIPSYQLTSVSFPNFKFSVYGL